jgi:hypothetical protein
MVNAIPKTRKGGNRRETGTEEWRLIWSCVYVESTGVAVGKLLLHMWLVGPDPTGVCLSLTRLRKIPCACAGMAMGEGDADG